MNLQKRLRSKDSVRSLNFWLTPYHLHLLQIASKRLKFVVHWKVRIRFISTLFQDKTIFERVTKVTQQYQRYYWRGESKGESSFSTLITFIRYESAHYIPIRYLPAQS